MKRAGARTTAKPASVKPAATAVSVTRRFTIASRARSVNRSAIEPSGRTHVALRRSSTTSTWRNWSVRSATAVNELWPTGVVLQPPPLTT